MEDSIAIYYLYSELLKLENMDFANEGKRVLDMGCGRGDVLKYIISSGADAFGMDLEKINVPNNLKKVILGDMNKIPFKDEYFDEVISINSYFPPYNENNNIYKIGKEVNRVLRKGGIWMISDPYTSLEDWRNGLVEFLEKEKLFNSALKEYKNYMLIFKKT